MVSFAFMATAIMYNLVGIEEFSYWMYLEMLLIGYFDGSLMVYMNVIYGFSFDDKITSFSLFRSIYAFA